MDQRIPLPVPYYELEYGVFNEIIKEHFGLKEFEVVAAEEGRNDSSLTFTAKKGANYDYDRKGVEEVKSGGNYTFKTAALVNDLADRDIIPEGKYVIDICW